MENIWVAIVLQGVAAFLFYGRAAHKEKEKKHSIGETVAYISLYAIVFGEILHVSVFSPLFSLQPVSKDLFLKWFAVAVCLSFFNSVRATLWHLVKEKTMIWASVLFTSLLIFGYVCAIFWHIGVVHDIGIACIVFVYSILGWYIIKEKAPLFREHFH